MELFERNFFKTLIIKNSFRGKTRIMSLPGGIIHCSGGIVVVGRKVGNVSFSSQGR